MRVLFLLIALARIAAPASGYVQAVDFPYYLHPKQQWERELVWLKNIGISIVEFDIPWSWHEVGPGTLDIAGRTSPRRDLLGFLHLLRRLEMKAWIRPVGSRSDFEKLLQPLLEKHGGPIAFVEGGAGVLDVPTPPLPVASISAIDGNALALSRQAFATGHGSLLWKDVEDALPPAGWIPGGPLLVKGAVSLSGQERVSVSPLRRAATLIQNWAPLLASMRTGLGPPSHTSVQQRLPSGVSAVELGPASNGASAVSLINQSEKAFHGELRAYHPSLKRVFTIPSINIPAGEALWIPINVPLASSNFCKECTNFSSRDSIVYATAELQSVEYENGILAMEFAAPAPGEVVLQLSNEPSGPFLAGGKPTPFDWDEKTLRARLPIPAGKGAGQRVRIGLAIEAPEASAFFINPVRLIIGQKNVLKTSYSSERLAGRSRLRLPERFAAKALVKSPAQIDYEIDVPPDAPHGDWANLGIEADGILLGRARLQLFRPASMRLSDALKLHFGAQTELPVSPPLVPIGPQAGRNLDITIRNNSPSIQNFVLEAEGDGFQFLPARKDVSIGGILERVVSLRVFGENAARGLRTGRLRLSGAAHLDMPLSFVVIPRGEAIGYSADLDADGLPEWILENEKIRAVFSGQDGGRWIEFVWKDSNLNFIPETGALVGSGPVEIKTREEGKDALLEVVGPGWMRTIRLEGGSMRLSMKQNSPLPPEVLQSEKKLQVLLGVSRADTAHAAYSLEQQK